MAEYRLFFSWQNDRKDTKAIINSALKRAKNKLKANGIDLFIDQDTRERVGKRNIDAEVLEKIRKCDIFVADLTPIITFNPPGDSHDLPKHMPNSNVMYEYGYALHAKGESRMIVLASLDKKQNEHIEYMPFDINHDTITLFTDEASLVGLTGWIRKIIDDVDRERAEQVPEYASSLLFHCEEGFTTEITIHPRYKRVIYTTPKLKDVSNPKTSQPSMEELVSNPFKMQQALLERMNVVQTSVATAKVINKTTNLSYVPVNLLFVNQGSEALDNLHISIRPSDGRVIFANTNVDEKWGMPIIRRDTDTIADEDGVFQKVTTLNPHASVVFDMVYIHTPYDIGEFKLFWELSSRNFSDSGELTVHVAPDFEYDYVENEKLVGTEKVFDLEETE